MQVNQPDGQICILCKWRHLVAKFVTDGSGAIWWPTLELMQVVAKGAGAFQGSRQTMKS